MITTTSRVLFRIPFTVYFLAWESPLKLFRLVAKELDQISGGYVWRIV